jgi:SAM-dependent methyltransferase
MPETQNSSDGVATYELADDASPYILLQRIDTQRWNPSNFLPEHKRPFDGLYHNFLMELESSVRHDAIVEQYLEQMETEYRELQPYLPDDVSSILDIGCGMAGIDLYLWEHYRDQSPDVTLFDKSEVSEDLYYRFYDNAAFYNSLDTARENLEMNGVPEDKINTVEATPENLREMGEVDFCLSLYSWGFHYPVDTYVDEITEVLSPDGRVVLDLRKETGEVTKHTDGYQACEEAFDTLEVIKDEHKYRRMALSDPVKAQSEDDETEPADTSESADPVEDTSSDREPAPVGA